MYLKVLPDGTIKVTAPYRITEAKVLAFINSKRSWIEKNVSRREEKVNKSKLYRGGDVFYIFGEPYQLEYRIGKSKVEIKDKNIILTYKNEEGLDYLYSKLNTRLDEYTRLYVNKYLDLLRDYGYRQIPEIKYRKMKSRWGVCFTRKNSITINSYLIHYPLRCLEYVVLHELCHFIIPNHSKRFYNILENRMPDYKEVLKILN